MIEFLLGIPVGALLVIVALFVWIRSAALHMITPGGRR